MSRPAAGDGLKGRSALLARIVAARSGATAVEYGLIAAIISAAVIAGLIPLGNSITSTFTAVSNGLSD